MLNKVDELLIQISNTLQAHKIDSPKLEARMMLGYVLGIDANQVMFDHRTLDETSLQELMNIVQLRTEHQPLDKILGYKDFYKSRFLVNKNVLSPRPDTETIVEAAIELAKMNKAKNTRRHSRFKRHCS